MRSTPATLDAATPFLHQLRGLVSKPELRGLVARLRPTIPDLDEADRSARSRSWSRRGRSRAASTTSIIPWSNERQSRPRRRRRRAGRPRHGKVFQETGYGLAGIDGESRSGDANGQYVRVDGGSGPNIVSSPTPSTGRDLVGSTAVPDRSAPEPSLSSSAKTPFRPDAPCENQQPPNLDSAGRRAAQAADGLGLAATPVVQALAGRVADLI